MRIVFDIEVSGINWPGTESEKKFLTMIRDFVYSRVKIIHEEIGDGTIIINLFDTIPDLHGVALFCLDVSEETEMKINGSLSLQDWEYITLALITFKNSLE